MQKPAAAADRTYVTQTINVDNGDTYENGYSSEEFDNDIEVDYFKFETKINLII
jgi:hypothetical protein